MNEANATTTVARKITVAETISVSARDVSVRIALVRMIPIEFAVLDNANSSALRCDGDSASSISE